MLFRFGGSGFRVQAWDSGSRGRGLGLRGSPVNLMPAQSTSQLKVRKGMIVAHPNRAIRIVITLSNENNGQESDKRNDKSKNNKRNGDTK